MNAGPEKVTSNLQKRRVVSTPCHTFRSEYGSIVRSAYHGNVKIPHTVRSAGLWVLLAGDVCSHAGVLK